MPLVTQERIWRNECIFTNQNQRFRIIFGTVSERNMTTGVGGMSVIKFMVVDDHTLFREGIVDLLEKEADLKCVATAQDASEAIKQLQEHSPDVILIDIALPTINGIELAKQIKQTFPDVGILMLTAYKYEQYIRASLEAGVDGFLLKTARRSDLVNAIRIVHGGGGVFDMEATRKVLSAMATESDKQDSQPDRLHGREVQVIRLAAMGMSNRMIGSQLHISESTVATHFVHIFRKLGVQSRTEAVTRALSEGWLIASDLIKPGAE
jgi:DNA-binding NarL/FixJ family response regulator